MMPFLSCAALQTPEDRVVCQRILHSWVDWQTNKLDFVRASAKRADASEFNLDP